MTRISTPYGPRIRASRRSTLSILKTILRGTSDGWGNKAAAISNACLLAARFFRQGQIRPVLIFSHPPAPVLGVRLCPAAGSNGKVAFGREYRKPEMGPGNRFFYMAPACI